MAGPAEVAVTLEAFEGFGETETPDEAVGGPAGSEQEDREEKDGLEALREDGGHTSEQDIRPGGRCQTGRFSGRRRDLHAVRIGGTDDYIGGMRAVVQRVLWARVEVAGEEKGRTGTGLLVYLGVGRGDTEKDADWICHKVLNLRIFPDETGRMNRSVQDVAGGILLVSQFTLYGDLRRGFRPGFSDAMEPVAAERLYGYALERLKASGLPVAAGVFGAHMAVSSLNDGPVTILLDSG